jgi:dihydrofolate synthase/folylpolyglutamate synthase
MYHAQLKHTVYSLFPQAMFRLFALRKSEIDVLILETGIGGRLDYTNALDAPACCAITRLDFDHVELLGNTLALIAKEKAGIAKRDVPLFTFSEQLVYMSY